MSVGPKSVVFKDSITRQSVGFSKLSTLAFFLIATSLKVAGASNVQSQFLLGTLNVGCQPKGIKIDAQGKFAFVAEMCGVRASKEAGFVPTARVVNIQKMATQKLLVTPVGIRRNGILANTEAEVHPGRPVAFFARAEGDSKSEAFKNMGITTVVDQRSHEIITHIPNYGQGSKILAMRPSGQDGRDILYVANYFSDDISVLDVTGVENETSKNGSKYFKSLIKLSSRFRGNPIRSYKIAPRGIAFVDDGKLALVLNTEAGSIIFVDTVKHRQIGELAPLPLSVTKVPMNVRHIVISKDGKKAFLGHMRGNAISKIDIPTLVGKVKAAQIGSGSFVLSEKVWNEILIPFGNGKTFISTAKYPADHPQLANQTFPRAHPNTIVLDPVSNRFLYVSNRTTAHADINKVDNRIRGKIDIIDTSSGEIVRSLVGGLQPTALDITPDGRVLISSGFKDNKLYFFDVESALRGLR